MDTVRRPFNMELPADLLALARSVKVRTGHSLYVVGGAVRDAVLGEMPKDFDVATGATPSQVVDCLKSAPGWAINEVGKSFGIVKARRWPCAHEYEIATFRQDVGHGRRPDSVNFTTIDEDVKRRDLTINALFFDIDRCEIVDLVGGLADIEAKVVRTVGDPHERFAEDRLRVLRAVRFACKLGYAIDKETRAAIARDPNLYGVSHERIHDEFTRAVASAKHVSHLLEVLTDFGLWDHVLSGLKVTMAARHDGYASSRITSRELPVVLAVLLDAEPYTRVAYRLNELKYSADEVNQTTFLLRYRDLEASTAYELRKAFNNRHVTMEMLKAYRFERGLPVTSLVRAFDTYINVTPISGTTLLAEGFTGKALGDELLRRETETFKRLL